MRLLCTADLHIGKKLNEFNLIEDQIYILKEIARIARERQPDAVIIAGDIYDRSVPPSEAVRVFDDFIDDLRQSVPSAHIMAISGNHDDADRLNVFRRELKHGRIHMIGLPPQSSDEHIERLTLEDKYGRVNFYMLPFVKPAMVRNIVASKPDEPLSYDEAVRRLIAREEINQNERNVMISHQFYLPKGNDPQNADRTDSEVIQVGNIDMIGADVLAAFDCAILGHLHRPVKAGDELHSYCGSPLAYSVSEAGQQKSIFEIELNEKGNIAADRIELKPLRRVIKLKGTLDEVADQACEDYVYAVLTDREDVELGYKYDRLSNAFPNLVSYSVDAGRQEIFEIPEEYQKDASELELCLKFLGEDIDEEGKVLLERAVNRALLRQQEE